MSTRPQDDAVLLAGAAGEERIAVRALLTRVGASWVESGINAFSEAARDGRVVAWTIGSATPVEALAALVANAPEAADAPVLLFLPAGAGRGAWEAGPWPPGWELLPHGIDPALLRHALARMQRVRRARQARSLQVESDEQRARDLDQRLRIALDAAGLNPWSIDLRTGKRTPGPRDVDFYGSELLSNDDFERRVLPGDMPVVRGLVQRANADPGRVASIEFRVRHTDGRIRWLSTRAHVQHDQAGAARLYGVTFDITARREAEAAVQEGRRQLNDVLRAGRMVLWRWTADMGFEIEFGAARHLHARGPVPTTGLVQRILRSDRARVIEAFQHALDSGLPYSDEFRLTGSDDALHTVRVQALPYVHGSAPEVRGIRGVLIDVSEHRQAERERDEASARLYQALSAAGMTAFELPAEAFAADPDGALRSVFGEVAQVDQAALDAALREAITSRGSIEHTYRHHAADGSLAWRRAFGRHETDETGNARIAGVLMDVSRQKRAETELEASRRWRDLAIDGAGMAVWEVDLVSGARRGTPHDLLLFGASPSSRAELSLLMHPDDIEPAEQAWRRAIGNGTPYSAEMRVRGADGRMRWIAKHGRTVREPDTGRQIMVGITMDIDARKRAEAEQQEALALARKASEAKSAFLASMSHEIRTPLNAVIGYTGLLADSVLPQPQRGYVETLRGSAQQLLSLINDILDFSRIEAGELPLERQPFSLVDCIESSLDLVATQAEARGLTLAAVACAGAGRMVLGDVTRVRQVVVNLLSNAVKFTEHGGVLCEADLQPEGIDARIRITVRDTGIGMDESVQSRLFQPFQQGDATTTRRFGGTGLGLSICHRLVGLMGGDIRVESRPGEGSRFEVSLRLPLVEEPTLRIPLALPARVAVAVRSELLRDALLRQLAALRVETRVVAPAPEGLLPEPDDCDALVTVEPVFERLEALPHYPQSSEHEPLATLVLSGQEHGLGYGRHWQRLVRSPRTLKPSRLRLALHALHAGDLMPSGARTTERGPEWQPAMRTPLRVLIAEDNAVNQKLLALQVEALGHRVQAVSSGQEAIDALRIDRFDVLLMDVEMPGMDGIETARRIREQFGDLSDEIYIAAVTAHATQEMRQRLVSTVMDDFLAKPVVREELVALLRRAAESAVPPES